MASHKKKPQALNAWAKALALFAILAALPALQHCSSNPLAGSNGQTEGPVGTAREAVYGASGLTAVTNGATVRSVNLLPNAGTHYTCTSSTLAEAAACAFQVSAYYINVPGASSYVESYTYNTTPFTCGMTNNVNVCVTLRAVSNGSTTVSGFAVPTTTYSGATCDSGVLSGWVGGPQPALQCQPLPVIAQTQHPQAIASETGVCTKKIGGGPKDLGMCEPHASKLSASLALSDTPIGHTPQLGPDMHVRLSYSHLDSGQPASPNYSNLGPRWTHSFLSFIQDDPAHAGQFVTRYAAGGGTVDYGVDAGSFNGTTGAWGAELQGTAILKRIPNTGTVTSYTLTEPDGTVQTFAQLDGASTYPRRVLLTRITDPQGNYVSLAYDGSNRLTSVQDAELHSTTFCYDPARTSCSTYSGGSLLISRIADHFGRHADLNYSSGQLSSIVDVLGITSSFTYDSGTGSDSNFITQLTTPYGNSTFTGGADFSANSRWLELTDPLSHTERVEYNESNGSIGATESATPSGITVENGQYNKHNTFYWDKLAYSLGYATGGGKDYTKAEITHWTVGGTGTPSPVVASIKRPLEGRVYYIYPGQHTNVPQVTGTSDKPAAIGRVMDDSSTQLTSFTYNTSGFLLSTTDPLGRITRYTYGNGNDIDLTKVEKKTATTSGTCTAASGACTQIAAYGSYNAYHEPGTYTDAAGQAWAYTYDSTTRKLTTVTDPQSNVTTYHYESSTPYRLSWVKDATAPFHDS